MRASWLTDIHLNFMRPLALRAFYDRVRQEQPHILLVTGDIAESDTLARCLDELAAIAPVYFVLGNHDYYKSSVAAVRGAMQRLDDRATWLPAHDPLRLTQRVVMLGVDGWGDARCGDLASTVQLSDWNLIDEFRRLKGDRAARIELLQRLGGNEARALRDQLGRAPESPELLVLTHVPPFPEACVYDDAQSEPAWLPWFTCIATGEVLADHARAHPDTRITVLCGHSHGIGRFSPLPNLEIRTGGWPRGIEGYGNPVVQATLEL
ncbi:MAG TPA: metallophosphoesterase [Kofleriaceae bacterium]|nr:metallophosphoesterase [Kofleriaceae bacterium]